MSLDNNRNITLLLQIQVFNRIGIAIYQNFVINSLSTVSAFPMYKTSNRSQIFFKIAVFKNFSVSARKRLCCRKNLKNPPIRKAVQRKDPGIFNVLLCHVNNFIKPETVTRENVKNLRHIWVVFWKIKQKGEWYP